MREWAVASSLVLEIPVGFDTPGVIRWPLEHLVHHHPGARFVRVSPRHPDVPEEVASRSIAVRAGAAGTAGALADRIVPTSTPTSC